MRIFENYRIAIEGREMAGAEAARYESMMAGMIQGLEHAKVGKALLKSIGKKRTHRDWVLIAPYSKKFHKQYGPCNALADDDRIPLVIGGVTVEAALLSISPLNFSKSPCNYGPLVRPVEVLVHELVHCDRSIARLQSNRELKGALKGYENEEEYFAVVFANVYASVHSLGAVADTGLRADHGYGVLPAAEMDSAVFLGHRENFQLVEKYCQQQTDLTKEVAGAGGKFNPFRTYYEWQAKGIRVH